jgi:hypothetical protein
VWIGRQLGLAEGDVRELLGVLGLLEELPQGVEGLPILWRLDQERLPVLDRVVALGQVLAQLGGAPEPGDLVRVGAPGLGGDLLVGGGQLLVAAGHPGQALQVRPGGGSVHVLGEGLAGGEEGAPGLAHVALLDRADLLGEAGLLVGEGIGDPRLADGHPAGVLAGAGEERVQGLQRAAALLVVRAGPGVEQVAGGRVARILGEHLGEELEGATEVLELLPAELGQAEGGLTSLRALPLLRAAELEGEGEILELAQRGVEPVERGDRLAVERVGLGDPSPGGGGGLAVLELPLAEQGHLSPQSDLLRGVRHRGGEALQDRDQAPPVLGRAQQPL